MIKKIRELADQLDLLSGTRVELTAFPSCAASLHVVRNQRLFVMDYSPTRQFGVDEVGEDDGFLASFRFTSSDFESAAKEMRALVGTGSSIRSVHNENVLSSLLPVKVEK